MDKEEIVFKLRHLYSRLIAPTVLPGPPCEMDKEKIMQLVSDRISEGKPLLFVRFGRIEIDVCENVKYTLHEKRSNWKFIQWKGQPNFINPFVTPLFSKNAGFFPSDNIEYLERFYQLMVKCMSEVDILASWGHNEMDFKEELKNAIKVDRETSTPLLTDHPWTLALEGKKVLVVHPFAETIKSQFARIDKVFPNATIWPKCQLDVMKAVQTAGSNKTPFKDWFEALKYMEDELSKRDFDVCILGCGAYGFPLAAHVKRMGKQAMHTGGITQVLFGITGNRWETEEKYLKVFPYIPTYKNEYWVRPSSADTPPNAVGIEGACYW